MPRLDAEKQPQEKQNRSKQQLDRCDCKAPQKIIIKNPFQEIGTMFCQKRQDNMCDFQTAFLITIPGIHRYVLDDRLKQIEAVKDIAFEEISSANLIF